MKQLYSLFLSTALMGLTTFTLIPVAIAAEELDSIEAATAGARVYEGFFDFYYQASNGTVLVEIDEWDKEFLYTNSLATGIGSNDIGLDRGQLGSGRVGKCGRHGDEVFR
jgi:hypothetical protein